MLIVFWLGNMVDLYEGLLFLGLIFGFLDIVGVYWGFGVSWEYCGFLVIVFFGIFFCLKCEFIVFLRFFYFLFMFDFFIIFIGVNVFNVDGILFFFKWISIGIKWFDVVYFGLVDVLMRFLIVVFWEKYF